jgi:hypothetical protein
MKIQLYLNAEATTPPRQEMKKEPPLGQWGEEAQYANKRKKKPGCS